MIDVPFALALAAGMVATVNPCGFAMLPAYLSFFVGVEGEGGATERDARPSVARALAVSAAVTTGFTVTFAVIGLVVSHVGNAVYDVSPWVTVVIGLALAALGIALLVGWEPIVRLPHLDRGGRTRGIGSMVVFGVSYAVASLGCTLTLILPLLATTFTDANVVSGVVAFLTYGLGMGLVLTALTVAIALARRSLVLSMRRLLPYVTRIAGGLLVVAGAYVAYFGTVEIRLGSGATGGSVTSRVWDWSARVSSWVQDTGPARVGAVLAVVVAASVAYVLAVRVER